jgi:ubiquinone/menaquinone biosynthesis C-methylase UbiE
VVTEPGEHMARRLREHTDRTGVPLEVVEAPAERLPFPDDSFDTVVATLVFCTIPDPPAALAEVSRVLRPGGRLLFLEHVRSHDPGRARWQDRLAPAWKVFGDGCHCNRDTLGTLRASSLSVEDVEDDHLPKAPPIVEPLIVGSAVAPSA